MSNDSNTPAFVWKADLYKAFFDHILAPLPPIEKDKVWHHFLEHCESYDGVPNGIHAACVQLDMKKFWIFMQVDWKATDEIEWQANSIARTHGIEDTFSLPGEFRATDGVGEGIKLFDNWLQERNHKFIWYDPGHDSYYGFVSKLENVDELIGFATSDELPLMRNPL
ncbi:hypothetical protein OAM69_06010 [bacterium]|nr:hypothetical protein [bacterium]